MTALLYIAITLGSVAAMEFVAWAAHKYLMHGWLWVWHEDHHKPHHDAAAITVRCATLHSPCPGSKEAPCFIFRERIFGGQPLPTTN